MMIDANFFKNRQKNYLHFDYPMQPQKIFDYVTDPKNVEKHAFYPFMHFELTSRKIKKDRTKIIKIQGKIDLLLSNANQRSDLSNILRI